MIHVDSWEAIIVLYAILKLIDLGISWGADVVQKWAGIKSTTMTFPLPKDGDNIIVAISTEKNSSPKTEK